MSAAALFSGFSPYHWLFGIVARERTCHSVCFCICYREPLESMRFLFSRWRSPPRLPVTYSQLPRACISSGGSMRLATFRHFCGVQEYSIFWVVPIAGSHWEVL